METSLNPNCLMENGKLFHKTLENITCSCNRQIEANQIEVYIYIYISEENMLKLYFQSPT